MIITVPVEIDKTEVKDFHDLVETAFQTAMQFGRELVRQALEAMDGELRDGRDKTRYRCKGKKNTSVKTKLGEVEYQRYVYEDKAVTEGVRHVCLLDKEVAIDKVGMMAPDLCLLIAGTVCENSYRGTAKAITEATGQSISPQGVWNVVQELGKQRQEQIDRHVELNEAHQGTGCIKSKLLYEENDGIWLKMQGKDRKEYGTSKEMKVGIAYDGAKWEGGKDGKRRRTLDNKIAHASFEQAKDFHKSKEGIIASRFDVNAIEVRMTNGDGAGWTQQSAGKNNLPVLDTFHRNKKLRECVRDGKMIKVLQELLYSGKIQELLDCIEAYSNSVETEEERARLQELLTYYRENKDAMTNCYERGIEIPETREPGVIHHARLGSMESNVFTLIGNRMKDRRACWSVSGAGNLANLLCLRHTTGFEDLFALPPLPSLEQEEEMDFGTPLSASKTPETVGKGSECYKRATLPNLPWLKAITSFVSFSNLHL